MAQSVVDAAHAQEVIGMIRRSVREQRKLPQVPSTLAKFADDTCVHIYNVGPWGHKQSLGSWGDWIVPACPDGQPYIEMLPAVPGMYHEPLPVDEQNFKLEPYEGTFVAEQIMGIGSHMPQGLSLVRFGVFIGSVRGPGAKPTEEELAAAREAFMGHCSKLFQEAEEAVAHGEGKATIDDKHRLAARILGRTDVTWMKQLTPTQKQECPMCGTSANVGIVRCPQCTYKFDPQKWDEMVIDGRVSDPARLAELTAASSGQSESAVKLRQKLAGKSREA